MCLTIGRENVFCGLGKRSIRYVFLSQVYFYFKVDGKVEQKSLKLGVVGLGHEA